MSLAQGIQAGLGLVEGFNRNYDRARAGRIKNEIGKLLAAPDEEIDFTGKIGPKQDLAQAGANARAADFNVVEQAQQPAPQMAPPEQAPAAGFRVAGGAPAAPYQPAGLRLPGVDVPTPTQAAVADERGPQMQAQMAARGQTPTTETRTRFVNPMSQFEKYKAASAKAAEFGDLELQKAYGDMAKASFQEGILGWTGKALSSLDSGDTTQLQALMSSKYLPNGYRYENMAVDPETGAVNFEVIGADGERSPGTMSRQEIMQTSLMLANSPKMIESMYNAQVAGQAEIAKEQRGLKKDLLLKNVDRQTALEKLGVEQGYDWQKTGMLEGGRNARFGAQNALGWFNAMSADSYRKGRLKLDQMKESGKATGGGSGLKTLKDWVSLGLDAKQANEAMRLVQAGNDVNTAYDAVATGYDPLAMQFAPGAGAVVPAQGGGFVRLNPEAVFKSITDPEVAEKAKSGYVASALSGLDQASPNWRADWATLSPKIKQQVLESQGVGMALGEFENYAGLKATAKPKLPAGGLRTIGTRQGNMVEVVRPAQGRRGTETVKIPVAEYQANPGAYRLAQ